MHFSFCWVFEAFHFVQYWKHTKFWKDFWVFPSCRYVELESHLVIVLSYTNDVYLCFKFMCFVDNDEHIRKKSSATYLQIPSGGPASSASAARKVMPKLLTSKCLIIKIENNRKFSVPNGIFLFFNCKSKVRFNCMGINHCDCEELISSTFW